MVSRSFRLTLIISALIVLDAITGATSHAATTEAREIRWFFEGTVPQAVTSWFTSGLPGEHIYQETPREDLYLLWIGRDDVGLKIREGRLELKLRGTEQNVSLPDVRATGTEERWEKAEWQYAEGDVDEVVRGFTGSGMKGKRINVEKVRRQRKYELDASGRVTPIDPKERRDRAVTMELTELMVDGKAYWTLGVDLISPSDELSEVRTKALVALLRAYPGPELAVERSHGYPEWLSGRTH